MRDRSAFLHHVLTMPTVVMDGPRTKAEIVACTDAELEILAPRFEQFRDEAAEMLAMVTDEQERRRLARCDA